MSFYISCYGDKEISAALVKTEQLSRRFWGTRCRCTGVHSLTQGICWASPPPPQVPKDQPSLPTSFSHPSISPFLFFSFFSVYILSLHFHFSLLYWSWAVGTPVPTPCPLVAVAFSPAPWCGPHLPPPPQPSSSSSLLLSWAVSPSLLVRLSVAVLVLVVPAVEVDVECHDATRCHASDESPVMTGGEGEQRDQIKEKTWNKLRHLCLREKGDTREMWRQKECVCLPVCYVCVYVSTLVC